MNIKQIRYFISVCNGESLSSAAKEQGVTVQAVSKAIANLEQELQGELFVRESRGVHPTPLGRRFLLKAELALREFDKLEQFAHAYRTHGDAIALQLGIVMPPFHRNEQACMSIATFVGKNLGAETKVTLETPESGLKALRHGTLDALIVVGSYQNADVDCMSIGTVMPSVIMSSSHPLADRKAITLDDMRPYPIIALKDFDDFNDSIVAEYRRRRADLQFVSLPFEEAPAFISQKQGLAFVTSVPAFEGVHARAAMRGVAPEDAIPVPICLVSMKAHKTASYDVLERWLASDLILFGCKLPDQQKDTQSPNAGESTRAASS